MLNEATLLARARALGGRTLFEVAATLRFPLRDPSRHKGAIGQLIEAALGAPGGSQPGPDFPSLGVELKTLPIEATGRTRESTFVCCAPREQEPSWDEAGVRKKLARVLWVPIEADVPLPQRRIGSAFLWSPDAELDRTLREDWEELMERLASSPEHLSAKHGRALQLRPKARDGMARAHAYDADDEVVLAMPRAFYLRRSVTTAMLRA